MRIGYFIILLLGLGFPSHAQRDLEYVRDIFHRIDSESQIDSILNYSWNRSNDLDRNVSAYQAVCKSMKAEYVFSPLTKLSYFQEGTSRLDNLIKEKPCVEKVYLRMMVQLEAPWFLGYHDQLESDAAYLSEYLPISTLPNEVKGLFIDKLLIANHSKLDFRKLVEFKAEMLKNKTLSQR